MGPVLTTRYAGILFGALFWATTGWADMAMSPASTALEEELDWLDQAAQLVRAAQGGRTDAVQFNKDVRESRARLRKLIQQSRNAELPSAHRQLHSSMLVVDVLLKSAAACQTAGRIVCPPLLMSQLRTVLKNTYSKLGEIKQTSNNFNGDGSQ